MRPRVYVTLEVLNRRLEDNKAILKKIIYADTRNKLTRDAIIEYICSCGEHGKRCFRALITLGAFCEDCAIKNQIETVKKINTEKTIRFVKKFKEINNEEILNNKFIHIINTLLEEQLQRVPDGFWDNKDAVDCYIVWFKHKYNIATDEDWYNVKSDDIGKNDGYALMKRHNDSLINFLKWYYPQNEFLQWKFCQVQKHYWDDKDNRKKCLEWLIKKLNYNTYEEYYNLSLKTFCDNECARLVGCYQDSTYELLKDLCSEYEWKAYKFGQAPIYYWNSQLNRKNWCDDYYNAHNFTSLDDWYRTNQDLIKQWYGAGLIWHYNGSPYEMLKDNYPEHNWDKSKFKVCGYSKISCEFSEILSKALAIPIRYARSVGGEYRIPTTRYSADTYIDSYGGIRNIIVEFHGCDVHGCIIEGCKFRKNLLKQENRYGCNFVTAYNKTSNKKQTLTDLGYVVIEIWECQYKTLNKNNTDWKRWFEEKLNFRSSNTTAIATTIQNFFTQNGIQSAPK